MMTWFFFFFFLIIFFLTQLDLAMNSLPFKGEKKLYLVTERKILQFFVFKHFLILLEMIDWI